MADPYAAFSSPVGGTDPYAAFSSPVGGSDPVVPINKAKLKADLQALAVNPKAMADARATRAGYDKSTQALTNRVPLIHTPGQTNPNISIADAQRQNDKDSAKAQGLSYNFEDELHAGVNALATGAKNLFGRGPGYSAGDAYAASMAADKERKVAYQQAHPWEYAGNELAGSAMNPLSYLGGEFIKGKQLASPVANALATTGRAAVVGGAQGAAYGAGDGQGLAQRGQNALLGAATGAATGATLNAAGEGLSAAATALPKRTNVPNLEQLTAAKNAAYQAVDSAGVAYKPQALQTMAADIGSDLAKAKINPLLHPKASEMLATIQDEASKPLTLTQLDQLRQVVRRDVISGGSDGEQMMGQKMIAGIDNFINKAKSGDLAAGDPRQAQTLIMRARDLNTRVSKIETIQDAIANAKLRAVRTGSGGNTDNAIRADIHRTLTKGTNFTPDEEAALEKIITGGKVQNVLRLVGKLSPTGNGLMAGLELMSAGAGEASHNHVLSGGAIGVGLTGLAAKTAADTMTESGARALTRQIASGAGLNTTEERVAARAILRLSAQAAKNPQARASLNQLLKGLAGQSGAPQAAQPQPAQNTQ